MIFFLNIHHVHMNYTTFGEILHVRIGKCKHSLHLHLYCLTTHFHSYDFQVLTLPYFFPCFDWAFYLWVRIFCFTSHSWFVFSKITDTCDIYQNYSYNIKYTLWIWWYCQHTVFPEIYMNDFFYMFTVVIATRYISIFVSL